MLSLESGPGEATTMHTHFSALNALNIFLAVLIVGSAWRLASLHLASASSPAAANLGRAMAFQY